MSKSIFEQLGGRDVILKVHKILYRKIFADAWMSQFFKDVNRSHIENQQTDFMAWKLGGPNDYSGQMIKRTHLHMFITDELFEHRNNLLKESLEEAGIPLALAQKWLDIDKAFKAAMHKNSISECVQTNKINEIMAFENPHGMKKAG